MRERDDTKALVCRERTACGGGDGTLPGEWARLGGWEGNTVRLRHGWDHDHGGVLLFCDLDNSHRPAHFTYASATAPGGAAAPVLDEFTAATCDGDDAWGGRCEGGG